MADPTQPIHLNFICKMVKYMDSIPSSLQTWCLEQKVFWVATSPLSGDGLVNLSPKGVDGSFRVIDGNRVWYEDLTGSGVATVAHVKENGRITILFNAFEGPPRILRLYGKGTVYEFGSPEYEELLPPGTRQTGSRAIIMIDVFKVATSCGFGVPFYTYRGPRNKLLKVSHKFESGQVPNEEGGKKTLKDYWEHSNAVCVDGLPALETAWESGREHNVPKEGWAKLGELPDDDEKVEKIEKHGLPAPVTGRQTTIEGKESVGKGPGGVRQEDLKVVMGFFAGAFAATIYLQFLRGFLAR